MFLVMTGKKKKKEKNFLKRGVREMGFIPESSTNGQECILVSKLRKPN